MKKWQVIDKKLLFDGITITLPGSGEVSSFVEAGDILIVLFRTKNIPEDPQNILALSSDGKVLWRIQKNEISENSSRQGANCFAGLYESEKNKVLAYHVNGTDWLVDLKTGEITPYNPSNGRPW